MVATFIKYSCRYFASVSISKFNMNLNKCYFRLNNDKNGLHITFLFKISEERVRQFNLERKPQENIGLTIQRITSSIKKVLVKVNKKKALKAEICESDVALYDSNNATVPETTTCDDLISNKIAVKLKILDHTYDVVYNIPWVLNVNLPKCMLVGFPIQPLNFEMVYGDKNHSEFNWYSSVPLNEKGNRIADIHLKWDMAGTGFNYTPTTQDIGKLLRLECIPKNESEMGPAVYAISSNVVEAGPGQCPFENRHMFTKKKLEGKSFRCVSYNILADLYCDSDFTRTVLHPYCPPYALAIDYRKLLVLKELMGYNADIICLQEVDTKIFNHTLTPTLENEFDGVFHKKGKEVAEGLVYFYRRDRFKLLSHSSIVLSEVIKINTCFEAILNAVKDSPAMATLTDRSTVAGAIILQSIDNPNNILIIGNTHLYFQPIADHIRLLQAGMFIYWLNSIFNKTKIEMPTSQISLIVCGDFNSTPSNGIYKLFTTGKVSSDLEDWRSNPKEIVTGLSLEQEVPLQSACGTPKYTNFTAEFADCLDYIFYDTRSLGVEQVIPLPSEEELKAHIALPSIVFPSDHIALVADLVFKK